MKLEIRVHNSSDEQEYSDIIENIILNMYNITRNLPIKGDVISVIGEKDTRDYEVTSRLIYSIDNKLIIVYFF